MRNYVQATYNSPLVTPSDIVRAPEHQILTIGTTPRQDLEAQGGDARHQVHFVKTLRRKAATHATKRTLTNEFITLCMRKLDGAFATRGF